MPLTLSLLAGEYAVIRLDPRSAVPAWATQGEFWTVSGTPEELSVVCAAAQVPEGSQAQAGWVLFKLHGPFDFGLTGVLASVLNPLRDAGIGIFAVSTFDTDYVLVPKGRQKEARQALERAGHQVRL